MVVLETKNGQGVALPLVRRVFGNIVAQELVSVQPMNLPSGLVFYLDFKYGTSVGKFTAGDDIIGKQGPNSPSGAFCSLRRRHRFLWCWTLWIFN